MLVEKNIPFFNYKKLFQEHTESFEEILHDVCSRGAYIMGEDLTLFEKKLADYTGAKHAIGVADGTIAILLALKAAGIQNGDEVIVPSHTFIATAAAAHHLGAKPVLVDCGRDHLIDPESIKKAITPKTKAIIPVQLNGRTAKMDQIMEIADHNNLIVVEDAAQALGSKYKGQSAGTFGIAGTFSFYPSKTLGAFGDGGAVITNDDEIAYKIRAFRDHGRASNGEIIGWGFNSRLDNLQAAILNFKLDRYDEDVEKRRFLAGIYEQKLRNCNHIILPFGPNEDTNHFDIYQNYEIECDHREALQNYLNDHGVKTIVQWGGKCIHQFHALGLNTNVPYTEEMSKKYMLLPLYPTLTEEDILYICTIIIDFYEKNI